MDLPLLFSEEFHRPQSNEAAWVGLYFNPENDSYRVVQRYPDMSSPLISVHEGDDPTEALRSVNDVIRGFAAEMYLDPEDNAPQPLDIARMERAEKDAIARAIAQEAERESPAPIAPEI